MSRAGQDGKVNAVGNRALVGHALGLQADQFAVDAALPNFGAKIIRRLTKAKIPMARAATPSRSARRRVASTA